MVTVFSYWTWIPGEGLGKIACKKRRRQEIEEMHHIAIPFTDEEVDETDLGVDGSYRPGELSSRSRRSPATRL
jgi:hypothetical protein